MSGRRIEVGVSGAAGKMGRRVVALAAASKDLRLSCALEGPRSAELGRDAGELAGAGPLGVPVADRLLPGACEVLIDFSTPAALPARLRECVAARAGWVVATTGWPASFRASLRRASTRIPILVAPNLSLGASFLAALSGLATRALSPHGAQAEIVEAHHDRKVDAPSGTALALAAAVEAGSGGRIRRRVYGRKGAAGPRADGELGIHSIRAGDIVGEHTVLFALSDERLELTHRAESRDVFARGALAAARFLAGRRAGLYSMEDLLCLDSILRASATRPRSSRG